jgi:hypothetical protein
MLNLLSIKCGYRSNIPTCCIIFFETIWYMKLGKWYNKLDGHNDYVHCPICLILKRSNKIIDCDDVNTNKPCNPCENK